MRRRSVQTIDRPPTAEQGRAAEIKAFMEQHAQRIVGALTLITGDRRAAEDAVQDALLEAVRAWPDDPPRDAKGWLATVAWRKFLDAARAETSRRQREERVEHEPAPSTNDEVDDTLQLYFLCAHPSLTPASAVALTLRAVGGLTTRQIAQAYLAPEATMAQRISRAKRTVASAGVDRPGDVSTVMRVLYLVFNEGYSGAIDLAAEGASHGLRVPSAGDGTLLADEVAGSPCMRIAPDSGYLYVDVDHERLPAQPLDLWVRVEFYDSRLGLIHFDYDRADGSAYSRAMDTIIMMGSGQWLSATVHLPDAAVSNRENHGTDFRFVASAARDEREYPSPDEFIWDRPIERLLSFGRGQHFCLGVHLARLEITIMMQEWLNRVPDFRVIGEAAERPPGGEAGLAASVANPPPCCAP